MPNEFRPENKKTQTRNAKTDDLHPIEPTPNFNKQHKICTHPVSPQGPPPPTARNSTGTTTRGVLQYPQNATAKLRTTTLAYALAHLNAPLKPRVESRLGSATGLLPALILSLPRLLGWQPTSLATRTAGGCRKKNPRACLFFVIILEFARARTLPQTSAHRTNPFRGAR